MMSDKTMGVVLLLVYNNVNELHNNILNNNLILSE